MFRSSTAGDYGLKICHEVENAIVEYAPFILISPFALTMVSIVFVHGLTGHRVKTWTHTESGTFWPADLLKQDVHLRRSRVLSFGYDADIAHFWSPAGQNRIGSHATNLVSALAQLHDETDTEGRRIMFVVHSLGGLVFENVRPLVFPVAEVIG